MNNGLGKLTTYRIDGQIVSKEEVERHHLKQYILNVLNEYYDPEYYHMELDLDEGTIDQFAEELSANFNVNSFRTLTKRFFIFDGEGGLSNDLKLPKIEKELELDDFTENE